jgi:uncharacterized protein involved in exopolysaccharide biosynthesis
MEEQNEYDEINLIDYARVVWKHKWLLAVTVIAVVAATAVVSLIMLPTYESKAVIMAVSQKDDPTGGMAGLAAQFGIATSTSSGLSELTNILRSDVLRERLIKKYNLLPHLLEPGAARTLTENGKMWAGIRLLRSDLKINVRQKDNAIEISMLHRNPEKAASITASAIDELNEYMSGEAKRVADTNRKYLESQLDKTPDPFIKSKIYTLIAQQLEKAMMAEVKENFAFKIIDPPRVPDKKVSPKRAQMVIIAFVVSLFLGIFAAFAVEYVRNARKGAKDRG